MAFSCAERDERELRTDAEKKTKEGGEGATLIWLVAWIAGGRSGLGSRTSSSLEAGKDGGAWRCGIGAPLLELLGRVLAHESERRLGLGNRGGGGCGWSAAQNQGGGRRRERIWIGCALVGLMLKTREGERLAGWGWIPRGFGGVAAAAEDLMDGWD